MLFIDTPVEHCISRNRTVGNVAGVWRSMTANELTKDGVRNPEWMADSTRHCHEGRSRAREVQTWRRSCSLLKISSEQLHR